MPKTTSTTKTCTTRAADGSAGDVDYGAMGSTYSSYRQPDPRIAALIEQALGDAATTVLNVGAGAGSYEPTGRRVTALEPSQSMRDQRPAHLPRAVDGVAEQLPFADGAFDASMATFSIHQWSDVEAGLREMRRVTRGPVVILTCDPGAVQDFWLVDYAPEVLATEARRYPAMDRIATALGGRVEVLPVPIPWDCRDGFNEAYYGRPEMLLVPAARTACSAWGFVSAESAAASVAALRADLVSGVWDARYGALRRQAVYEGSLRLVVAR
ncbi:class I SAM-dependent methyltransferase [Acidovorax sp. Root217]|uniref:class I SAM-dependent methyltransferase n=1 Tax=Acidovorax sp. Root217 TaxID=1736492 RepID=UPI00071032E1|nr:class I SAM-dependent methyltransferase [Acidovorax sp. Root217]KRC30591.1 ubiquinone biosynthesis protein [Acidovorax sp. Root217]